MSSCSHCTALYITSIITGFGPHAHSKIAQDRFALLEVTGILLGAGTTILSALLIFYRIYSVSQKNTLSSHRGRYTNILYLLIETSSLYAIGLFLYAIPGVIPLTDANVRWLQGWFCYSDPIFSFTSVRIIAMPQRLWSLTFSF